MKTKKHFYETFAKQLLATLRSDFHNDTSNFEGGGLTLITYKKV